MILDVSGRPMILELPNSPCCAVPSILDSNKTAFNTTVHAIGQVLDAIVDTAKKQVIRILDIGVGEYCIFEVQNT